MAANTVPIFVLLPNVGWSAAITAANTAYDGTGTVNLVWTAGAEGGFIESIFIRHLGTNTASLVRVFLNNGSTPTTAANNSLIQEIATTSVTASNINALPTYEYAINRRVIGGYRLYATLATAVAAGIIVGCYGGNY